jgi:hypothetical protein
MNTTLNRFWTAEEIADLSDAGLEDLISICQNGERIASATRNGRAQRRYGFLLERLCYPEQDRRRKAR